LGDYQLSADGYVGFSDLVPIGQNYADGNLGGTVDSSELFKRYGIFDYDGSVSFEDLVAIAKNYGLTTP
jgi:hypothetical protein